MITSVRCLSCKYDLKNLTEHRCPECGHEFDPDNPKTFDTRPRLAGTTWTEVLLPLLFAMVLTFVFDIFNLKDEPLSTMVLCTLILWGPGFLLYRAARWLVRRLRR